MKGLFNIFINIVIDELTEYLNYTEKLIKKLNSELEVQVQIIKSDNSEEYGEVINDIYLNFKFISQIQKVNYLIYCCSKIESILQLIVSRIEKKNNIKFKEKKYKGKRMSKLEKYSKFIVESTKIEEPFNLDQWNELLLCYQIRNKIVHNNFIINKSLQKKILGNNSINRKIIIKPYVFDEKGLAKSYTINLEDDFCSYLLETIKIVLTKFQQIYSLI